MIEKLKLEPYIPESLVVHLYSKDGHLIAERYDTIYWVREEYFNVGCEKVDCYVDAKLFCTFAQSIKSIVVKDGKIRLVLFNGAKYDLDMVAESNIPTYHFGELKYKSVFDFGGVENAASKSPLQKELNTVYADKDGCVASDSIVAGVSGKFKSEIPFAVPEGIHSMLNGAEAQWEIKDGNLYVAFGAYKIVAVLSKLPDFAWWEASRGAFANLGEFTPISGLKSSLTRLSNFGASVYIKDGKIAVNKDHYEPFTLQGAGEIFDIANLNAIAVDEEMGIQLSGGNLYLKTADAMFVCCSVDMDNPAAHEDFDDDVGVAKKEELDTPVELSIDKPAKKTTTKKTSKKK